MKRLRIKILLCLLLGTSLYPLMSVAQETPRRDITGAAPEAAALPPKVAPTTTRPTTQPLSRFALLNGTEGYWRIGRDHAGVWWFVSPQGQAEFLNTVTTVQPSLLPRDQDGPGYTSVDWDPAGEHDAELERWAAVTLRRVKGTGFKGLGAWSHPVLHKYDVPMTRDLNVWAWFKERSLRLFSPDWSTVAESTIEMQVKPLRDNRNLVGYYIDNELDWGDATSGPGFYFDDLAPGDPNRAQVTGVIRSTWGTVDAFNKDWGTTFAGWPDLDAVRQLPRRPTQAYRRLGSAWLKHLASAYFKLTTALIRKHDPNHLVLGVRFRGYAVPEVVEASRGYTDAQSLNYYVSDARLDPQMFRRTYELSGQPLIITEYSFHSLDGRSGNRNTVGFPAQVLDQEARAQAYREFTTRLARVPYVIGADWFQWMDEPPSGRRMDGEDVNFGVVDIDDRPYAGLVEAIRDTSPRLNGVHEASSRDGGEDLWREQFARNLPSHRVPHLDKPIRLNGELSDWPQSARLGGIRAAGTVGSERSKLPAPNVYVGWRPEGLFVAMEVFDHNLSTAPARGWWWSRDGVEFFVSTRPVPADRVGYDEFCHHFFFIPADFPAYDGIGGTLGQWHSPGDTLKAPLVPHPLGRNSVRVLPDRYVVEIFLPATALNGFDPAGHPSLAFNVHVRNYQHALEYFWSAPKQVITQARPNTWGTALLSPAGSTPAAAPAAPVANLGDGASPVGQ